jgi:hypothetical protein
VLLELRQRVENGEVGDLAAIDWWGWYGDRFVRSRQDAEKRLAIAKAENPDAAYEAAKARNAANVRAYRERKSKLRVVTPAPAYNGDVSGAANAAPVAPPTTKQIIEAREPREREAINTIIELFKGLSWEGRKETIRQIHRCYEE